MTKVRDICTRALRRINVNDAIETPSAHDMQTAAEELSELMRGWRSRGVDMMLREDWSADDVFVFFVPPVELESDVIAALGYRGEFDASSHALPTGMTGDVYKISAAGGAWALNDYAVFDGATWLKGRDSGQFHGPVIALLGRRLCEEFGAEPSALLISSATDGWATIQPYYVKPPLAGFDRTLTSMPSRTMANSFGEG